MAYAHSRGVLHRDLKPANVMVGAFGEVQVVDWGLAKVVAHGGKADERRARDAREIQTILETVRSSEGSGSGSDSMVGSVMGTPEYMSPEQAQGQVDRLDERSDVFSLGAMLCEILTGYPPYYQEGSAGNTLTDAARGRTDAGLARLDACDADPELVELTKECLLAAPAARPSHAGVVAERFQEYLLSVEERARAAQIEVAVQRRGRRLTVALAATILVASLGAGGGWLWVQQQEIVRERAVAQREREVQSAVTAALNEASVAQGEKRWEDAVAAADRARAVAETGGAGDDLLGRVEAVRSEVERAGAAEGSRIAQEQANARFLADLGEALMGDPSLTSDPTSREALLARDALCAQVFRDEGIDIDAMEPAAVAAALKGRGMGIEIAPTLHGWLTLRRLHSMREADRTRRPEDKTAGRAARRDRARDGRRPAPRRPARGDAERRAGGPARARRERPPGAAGRRRSTSWASRSPSPRSARKRSACSRRASHGIRTSSGSACRWPSCSRSRGTWRSSGRPKRSAPTTWACAGGSTSPSAEQRRWSSGRETTGGRRS